VDRTLNTRTTVRLPPEVLGRLTFLSQVLTKQQMLHFSPKARIIVTAAGFRQRANDRSLKRGYSPARYPTKAPPRDSERATLTAALCSKPKFPSPEGYEPRFGDGAFYLTYTCAQPNTPVGFVTQVGVTHLISK
jgi:hypothetical protein